MYQQNNSIYISETENLERRFLLNVLSRCRDFCLKEHHCFCRFLDAPSSSSVVPLKFLMTSFLAAPGLLLEKVPDPAVFVSPFAWWPTPPARNMALLLLLEHEAAAAASSAIFTSSPIKSTESSNLNFFWMCSGVGEQEEEEELGVLEGEEEEMVSLVSSLSEPFIFLFLGDVMLPLSALTSVVAALASWVGGGGGLGADKPVGNMKKREY